MLLLLPGLSMIFGGIRYKEQYFNKVHTRVRGVRICMYGGVPARRW